MSGIISADTKNRLLSAFRRNFRVDGLSTNIPENREYPYYPDLGPLPEIESERLQLVRELDLKNVPSGTVIGIDSYLEKELREDGDGPFLGHPDAVNTVEVVDTKRGRYLRMWRRQISEYTSAENRRSSQGQGLFVSLVDFLSDQWRSGTENGQLLSHPEQRKFSHLELPYFEEGQGPKGNIKPPNPEKSYINPTVRIFVQFPKNEVKP